MSIDDNSTKLYKRLCELKLEENRVQIEIKNMLSSSNRISFSEAKALNLAKTGIKNQIHSVESKMFSGNIV